MKKKLLAYFFSLALILTVVLGSSMVANAGGAEEEWGDDTTNQEITSFVPWGNFVPSTGSETDGIHPATLEYAIRKFNANITFESGKTIRLDGWNYYEYRGGYSAMGSNPYENFYLYFFDETGEKVDITPDYVPIGTFTAKLFRNSGTTPIYEEKIKIIDPSSVIGTTSENKATFTCSDSKRFEETWYPVDADYTGEYIYTNVATEEYGYVPTFASIWKYEDGIATRVNKGSDAGYGEHTFSHVYEETANTYLVVGETNISTKATSEVIWQAKKELASIAIKTEASYKVWNSDYTNIPLTITYTDGTTDTYTTWKDASQLPNATGDGSYVWKDGLEITTANGDTIYLGLKDGNGEIQSLARGEWKPGTYTCFAYLEVNRDIDAEAPFVVEDYEAKELDPTSISPEEYTITPENPAFYTVTTGDKSVEIEVYNVTGADMSCYFFYREIGSNNPWNARQWSDASGSRRYTLDPNKEYLFIMLTDEGVEGTIGVYVKGSTKSATVNVDEVDVADLSAWAKLPVTLQFVGEDGVTEVGTQKIGNWDSYYYEPGCGVKTTKHNERIYYALYDEDTKVEVAILSDEMLEFIGSVDNPEELELIFAELGIDSTVTEPGTYTVKVFKNSISDATLIGSKEIEVINSADVPECDKHSWSSWKTVKEATCKDAGTKERVCEVCKTTETDDIPKLTKHTYDAGTVTTEPTCTEEGVLTKRCTVCEKEVKEDIETIPHETVKAKKASFDVEGTTAGINCSMCGRSDVKTIPAVKDVKLSYTSATYSGSTKKPSVTIKDSKNKTLSTSNYTVSYESGRKYPGEYAVTITLKGNYEGTKELTFKIQPKEPTSLKATLTPGNVVKVSWKAATGADAYRVYCAPYATKDYDEYTEVTGTSLEFEELDPGVKYSFKVVPCYETKTGFEASSKTASTSASTLATVKGVSVEKYSSTKVRVKWTNVANETGYDIARIDANGVADITTYKSTSGKSKVVKAVAKEEFSYRVRAYKYVNGKRIEGEWSEPVTFTLRTVKAVKDVKAVLDQAPNRITVTWSEVDDATGYNVYIKKNSGKYSNAVYTSETALYMTKLDEGAKYTFKVEPCYKEGDQVVATGTSDTAIAYTLKQMAKPKAAKSSSQVKITWTNISGESGYEVSQSTSEEEINVVKTWKTTSGTSTKLPAEKNVTYYYRVRAFKTVGEETIYGEWSDAREYTRK